MKNNTRNADRTMDYRAALTAERARLSGVMEAALEALAAPGSAGLEDQPPLVHEQFVALRLNSSDRRKLRLIDAALERMQCIACRVRSSWTGAANTACMGR